MSLRMPNKRSAMRRPPNPTRNRAAASQAVLRSDGFEGRCRLFSRSAASRARSAGANKTHGLRVSSGAGEFGA